MRGMLLLPHFDNLGVYVWLGDPAMQAGHMAFPLVENTQNKDRCRAWKPTSGQNVAKGVKKTKCNACQRIFSRSSSCSA